MRLEAGEDDTVSFEDLKSAAAIGSFLLAGGAIIAAWIAWRAVVAVKLDRMTEDLKSLVEQQHAFEREVRTGYATIASISDLRAAIDRGFAAMTERIDQLMSRKS